MFRGFLKNGLWQGHTWKGETHLPGTGYWKISAKLKEKKDIKNSHGIISY